MVYRILVARKTFSIVDDEDAPRVAVVDWAIRRQGGTAYASTSDPRIGRNHRLMHRLIIRAPVGAIVDHVNGNGLDNRKQNLRVVTTRQNAQNAFVMQPVDFEKTSRFKGVSRVGERWLASIVHDSAAVGLGLFDDEEIAARAYDAAALMYFGEFARTNEMMGLLTGQTIVDRNALAADGPEMPTPVRLTREQLGLLPHEPTPLVKRNARQRRRLHRSAKRQKYLRENLAAPD